MYAYTLIAIIQNIKFPYCLYRSDQGWLPGRFTISQQACEITSSTRELREDFARSWPLGDAAPLPGILQEGPGMGKAPTLWTRLVFPSTSRCHFVFSINFVYPKSLNLQISWQNRTEFPKFTPIPPVTNIWYCCGTLIWRNKLSNSNARYSLNLASPPWAGVLEACFPAGGFPFGDRGGFESYHQILAPVSPYLAVSSLGCTSALPVLWAIPSESINQNKSPFS